MVLLEVKLTLGAPPAHRGEDGNAGPGRPLQPGGAAGENSEDHVQCPGKCYYCQHGNFPKIGGSWII